MQFIKDVLNGMQAPGRSVASTGYQFGSYIGYHYWALILLIVALAIVVALYRRRRRQSSR